MTRHRQLSPSLFRIRVPRIKTRARGWNLPRGISAFHARYLIGCRSAESISRAEEARKTRWAKLQRTEVNPIPGREKRRTMKEEKKKRGRRTTMFSPHPWYAKCSVSLAGIQREKQATGLATVSAKPIIGSLRNWYIRVPTVNQGFDSRPRFLRIKERRLSEFSLLLATINSRRLQWPLGVVTTPCNAFSRSPRRHLLLPPPSFLLHFRRCVCRRIEFRAIRFDARSISFCIDFAEITPCVSPRYFIGGLCWSIVRCIRRIQGYVSFFTSYRETKQLLGNV